MELVTPTIRQGGVNTVFVMVCMAFLLTCKVEGGNNIGPSRISYHQ